MCNTFALICHSLISGASFAYRLPQQLQEQHALGYLSSWAYSAVLLAQPWCCAVSAGRHALHVMFDSFLLRCLREVSSRTRWCMPAISTTPELHFENSYMMASYQLPLTHTLRTRPRDGREIHARAH